MIKSLDASADATRSAALMSIYITPGIFKLMVGTTLSKMVLTCLGVVPFSRKATGPNRLSLYPRVTTDENSSASLKISIAILKTILPSTSRSAQKGGNSRQCHPGFFDVEVAYSQASLDPLAV